MPPIPAEVQVVISLPDGTEIPVRGEIDVEAGGLRVERPGGRGRDLLEELTLPLAARGWQTTGMPAPDAVIGTGRKAVRATWRKEDVALTISLFDAGFGQSTVAELGIEGAPPAWKVQVSVPGSRPLYAAGPFPGEDLELDDGALCLHGAPGVAETWSAALAKNKWTKTRAGWWTREGRKILVEVERDDACLTLDRSLGAAWEALGLPLGDAMVTRREVDSLEVRLATAEAVGPLVKSVEAALERGGWSPTTEGAWSRDGARIHLYPQAGSPELALRSTPAPYPSADGIRVGVEIAPGQVLPLPGAVFFDESRQVPVVWQTDPSPTSGEEPVAAALAAGVGALGWVRESAGPSGEETWTRGTDRFVFDAGTGFDQGRAESTSEAALQTGLRRWTVALPEGTALVAQTDRLTMDGRAACLPTADVAALVSTWEGALRAAGWQASGAWWTRAGRSVRVKPMPEAPGEHVCVVVDAPVAVWWTRLGLDVGGAFVVDGRDGELAMLFASEADARAAAARTTRTLVDGGWTSTPPEEPAEERGMTFVDQAYHLGYQQLTITLATGPDSYSVAIRRRGPPLEP